MMTEKDDISSYVYGTCLFHLMRIFYSFHLLIGLLVFLVGFLFVLFCFLFFWGDFCCCLDILDTDLLLSALNSNSFLPFCWLSLQLIISFAVQKLPGFHAIPYQLLVFFFEAAVLRTSLTVSIS